MATQRGYIHRAVLCRPTLHQRVGGHQAAGFLAETVDKKYRLRSLSPVKSLTLGSKTRHAARIYSQILSYNLDSREIPWQLEIRMLMGARDLSVAPGLAIEVLKTSSL